MEVTRECSSSSSADTAMISAPKPESDIYGLGRSMEEGRGGDGVFINSISESEASTDRGREEEDEDENRERDHGRE